MVFLSIHNIANRTGRTVVVAGSGAYAGYISYWEIPIFVSDAFSVNPSDELHDKFLFYFLKNIQNKIYATKKGSGVPHVHGSSIAKFEIPLPPLPIQEEIVKILDRFAEYTAELQARKEQYEYYRNLLLTNNFAYGSADDKQKITGNAREEWKWMTLGEVGDICMCKRIMKNQTNNSNGIPFYKIGTFGKKADAYISKKLYEEYKNQYSFPKKGEILISASGTIGRAVIYDGQDAYFQDSNIVWISNKENLVLNKKLFKFF